MTSTRCKKKNMTNYENIMLKFAMNIAKKLFSFILRIIFFAIFFLNYQNFMIVNIILQIFSFE